MFYILKCNFCNRYRPTNMSLSSLSNLLVTSCFQEILSICSFLSNLVVVFCYIFIITLKSVLMSPLSLPILLIHMVSFFSLINLADFCLSVMVVTQRTCLGFADSLFLPLFYFHVTSPPSFPSPPYPYSAALGFICSCFL